MPNPIFRARWLAPVLLLALAACAQPSREARMVAAQAAVDPPMLWRVEALDAAGHLSAALTVCADRAMREGFARATAEIGGRSCIPLKGAVDRPGLYAARCQMDGGRYGLTVNRSGDAERDFEIAFALKALDGTYAGARQTRRFHKLGPCPDGWGIGDQARADGSPTVNALAGGWAGQ